MLGSTLDATGVTLEPHIVKLERLLDVGFATRGGYVAAVGWSRFDSEAADVECSLGLAVGAVDHAFGIVTTERLLGVDSAMVDGIFGLVAAVVLGLTSAGFGAVAVEALSAVKFEGSALVPMRVPVAPQSVVRMVVPLDLHDKSPSES